MRWIVSASRRTDIPAFYADWLLARMRAGWAASVNPFNGRAVRVSLQPEDVRALVLWSKDLSAFLPSARVLAERFPLYVQYTITGLPPALEPHVPPPERTVAAAHALAGLVGSGAVQWRYDPILLGGPLDEAWHLERFRGLAAALEGATTRCIVSFATFYRKVRRNLLRVAPHGASLAPVPPRRASALASALAAIATAHGMTLHACCSSDALGPDVLPAACVDAAHIEALWPGAGAGVPRAASRPGCGCAASRDIGLYDTCPHGCAYCYANADPARARANHSLAGGDGPVLIGRLEEDGEGTRHRP